MITLIKKIIKKQRLLKKYKKGDKQFSDLFYLCKSFDWSDDERHFFIHNYNCENSCYNRLKKL